MTKVPPSLCIFSRIHVIFFLDVRDAGKHQCERAPEAMVTMRMRGWNVGLYL